MSGYRPSRDRTTMQRRQWWIFVLLTALSCSCSRKSDDSSKRSRNDEVARKLATLGYLGSVPVVPDEAREGVTLLVPDKVFPGVNVTCNLDSTSCYIFSMTGEILHSIDSTETKAGFLEPYDEHQFIYLTRQAEMGLVSWTGEPSWRSDGVDISFHHDFLANSDGTIYALYAQERWVEHKGTRIPIFDNGVALIQPDGRYEKVVSFFDKIGDHVPEWRLNTLAEAMQAKTLAKAEHGWSHKSAQYASANNATDIFHANAVTRAVVDTAKWKKGALIVSARYVDGVFVFDEQGRELQWSYEGGVEGPHAVESLDNGHILLYDNGMYRGYSRVIEIDPTTDNIVHEYRSEEPLFYSAFMGSAQALPNGNLLIAESSTGRDFEVTRAGEMVWEYWHSVNEAHKTRYIQYRTWRVTGDNNSVKALNELNDKHYGENGVSRNLAVIKRRITTTKAAWRAFLEGSAGSSHIAVNFFVADDQIKFSASALGLPVGAHEYRIVVTSGPCAHGPESASGNAGEARILADFGDVLITAQSGTTLFTGAVKLDAVPGGLDAFRGHFLSMKDSSGRSVACGAIGT